MEGAVIIADPKGQCYGFVKEIHKYLEKKDGKGFSVILSDIQRKEFRSYCTRPKRAMESF